MTQSPDRPAHTSINDYTRIAIALHDKLRLTFRDARVSVSYYGGGGVHIDFLWPYTAAGHQLTLQLVSDYHRARVQLMVPDGRLPVRDGVVSSWDVFYDHDCHSPLRVLGVRNTRSDGVEVGQPFMLRIDLPNVDVETAPAPLLTNDIIQQVQMWSIRQLPVKSR